jgi:hypothetical protein
MDVTSPNFSLSLRSTTRSPFAWLQEHTCETAEELLDCVRKEPGDAGSIPVNENGQFERKGIKDGDVDL